MWKETLEKVRAQEAGFGGELNGPASEAEIKKFQEEISKVGASVPDEYYDFLRVINGFEYNGYIIYGIDEELLDGATAKGTTGFLLQRKVWEETSSGEYTYLGEGSMDLYAYGVETKKFYVLDNGSDDVMEEFDSFDELLERIMSHSLL
ncbi:YrhA family protein [Butyrivibrio sp. JL13D10]|uniref:YrhA family protein n=1 Tax=Butyrivibrio sp. JL13D10 TaxID=3236815 RepID=UPI0038B48718